MPKQRYVVCVCTRVLMEDNDEQDTKLGRTKGWSRTKNHAGRTQWYPPKVFTRAVLRRLALVLAPCVSSGSFLVNLG